MTTREILSIRLLEVERIAKLLWLCPKGENGVRGDIEKAVIDIKTKWRVHEILPRTSMGLVISATRWPWSPHGAGPWPEPESGTKLFVEPRPGAGANLGVCLVVSGTDARFS